MAQVKTINYIPPNKREVGLYKRVTNDLDQVLSTTYYPEIEKIKNLYNPSSPSYDPEYILSILGASTLKNLLSDVVDKTTLTMIISDIHNIKGTQKGFEAILKLLKLNYKQIQYTTLDNGCTEALIIFDSNERINVTDIADLARFSEEIFPLCLTLSE